MMKDFMLFLSHVLNLILMTVFVAVLSFVSGMAIGTYDINGIASEVRRMNAQELDKNKPKKEKAEKARKMGFHLVDD